MQHKLNDIRDWAREKAQSGEEPPWAWYQYMKLIEALDSIIQGFSATTTENSQRSGARLGNTLRLVDATFEPGTFQPHQDDDGIEMPM